MSQHGTEIVACGGVGGLESNGSSQLFPGLAVGARRAQDMSEKDVGRCIHGAKRQSLPKPINCRGRLAIVCKRLRQMNQRKLKARVETHCCLKLPNCRLRVRLSQHRVSKQIVQFRALR
ncbi:MAG TPA: hypothetical protein VKD65_13110 [Candidatus Angelobacter sp.]|nr:hypothetical protein [Candidatus Angelobacter sp.]